MDIKYEDLKRIGDRFEFTTTLEKNTDIFKLPDLPYCIGDTRYSRIQLEKSNFATDYVSPGTRIEGTSGLFKDVRGFQLSLTDLEKKLNTKIEVTSGGLYSSMTDIKNSLSGELLTTASILATSFKNSDTKIRNDFTITANQINSRITGVDGKYSLLERRLEGLYSEVYDSNGSSKLTQLSDLVEARVKKDELDSLIRLSGDNIWLAISNRVEDATSLSGKGKEIVSEINLTKDSVKISGKFVHITGQTKIDSAVIDSTMIKSVSASKLTAGTINANDVNIINLNANKIVGLDSTFIRTLWNSISGGNIEITGDALKTKSSLGYYAEMSGGRFELWNERGQKLGMLGTQKDIDEPFHRYLSVGIEHDKGFSISKMKTADANAYTRILTI